MGSQVPQALYWGDPGTEFLGLLGTRLGTSLSWVQVVFKAFCWGEFLSKFSGALYMEATGAEFPGLVGTHWGDPGTGFLGF